MRDDWDFSARHADGHVDIPRLREGGVSAVFLAAYVPGRGKPGSLAAAAQAQLDRIHATARSFEEDLQFARNSAEVRRAKSDGKIALLIGIEGGHLIEGSLDILREFSERGAVYMTLTHAFHTDWADSSGVHDDLAPLHGGLTAFGRDVVREMNRLGMMVDVSHVSDSTFWDVLDASTAPVIASHSSCRAIAAHRRNLSDEMIRAIAQRGGVVQINFAAAFVDPTFPPLSSRIVEEWSSRGGFKKSPFARHVTPLSVLVDHFEHALRLAGPEHVGIGSDFDGVAALPRGMEDCSKLPNLTAELLQRGHSEATLAKVLGGNILRVMDGCQPHAAPMAYGRAVAAVSRSTSVATGWDSLAYALRIACESYGDLDHDDWCAALGLSWMVGAAPGERDMRHWSMYARDAFLIEAGRLLGLELRGIHPPQAARGLSRISEFEQHFDASYRPLILRALEHGQPVVAWQGWPGERALSWGVIREPCTDGVGFRGVTIWSKAELEAPIEHILIRPSIQLYVLERLSPTPPTETRLCDLVLDHARCIFENELEKRHGVVTGAAAFDEWIARLADNGADEHCKAAIAALEAGLRFVQRNPSSDRLEALARETRRMLGSLRAVRGVTPSSERVALMLEARAAAVALQQALGQAIRRGRQGRLEGVSG